MLLRKCPFTLKTITSPVDKAYNRALFDKSTTFGAVVVYGKVTISKIGGTPKLTKVSFGGHFSK